MQTIAMEILFYVCNSNIINYICIVISFVIRMTIEEIIRSCSPIETVNILKEKSIQIPSWDILVKDYEPKLHDIVTTQTRRKDKTLKDGTIERASRIHLGLEKLLVSRMTEFMFAIPVKRIYHNVNKDETRHNIANAIELIYKHARINNENIKRGKYYFGGCEFFTIWYTVKARNSLYGFNCNYKLKCKSYSPMDGYRLYPLFDDRDDMVAMSIEYDRTVGTRTMTYFETYTAEHHYKWINETSEWKQDGEIDEIRLLKIPGVYAYRCAPIYDGLSHIRSEIEYTLSRNSDVIAYNSAPILKISGRVTGEEQKGESKRIYRTEAGGDVAYVSWTQAIEALKYQVDKLLSFYFMMAQMPDISFEKMSGLGNIGYDARKTLLTDAHLKVGDESGAFIEAFEREYNVIKEFLKFMNIGWKDAIDEIEVEHVISPFIQNNVSDDIKMYMTANGGKPVMSQRESIGYLGLTPNIENTLSMIADEKVDAEDYKSQVLGNLE